VPQQRDGNSDRPEGERSQTRGREKPPFKGGSGRVRLPEKGGCSDWKATEKHLKSVIAARGGRWAGVSYLIVSKGVHAGPW